MSEDDYIVIMWDIIITYQISVTDPVTEKW